MRSSGRTELSIAMVGTRGVPARYGGFETCIDEVGSRLAERGHRVRVYCRSSTAERRAAHHGMELVHRGAVHRRSLETLSHSGLSVAHLVTHRTDVAIVFNAANSPYLPVIRAARIPVATHVDGLEWKRDKWQGVGRRYYRMAESAAVRWSDALIADAQGIADYYRSEFHAETRLIGYGAPRIVAREDLLTTTGLRPQGYHLVVARFEPENHVHTIVDGYRRSAATLPLVVVGSAPYADDYTTQVHALADDRVRFLGGVWDQQLLDQLYANARTYLHGHSVGGTNPSLLRAVGAGTPTIAYDVVFNREVLGSVGAYFGGEDELAQRVEAAEKVGDDAAVRDVIRVRALDYDWDDVADRYEMLCRDLADRVQARAHRPLTVQRVGARTSRPEQAGGVRAAEAGTPEVVES